MRLNIHIDRVVADRPISREELAETIQAGMARSIAESGLPSILASSSMRPAAAAPTGQGGVGEAIYRSLER